MCRRGAAIRPIVHAGFAYVFVDDSTTALSVGAGFEAGIRLERGHDVDANLGVSGSRFDHQEINVGYLYRFQ